MLPKKYTFPRPATTVDSIQPKQRKLMPRPASVLNTEQRTDIQCREAVTTDQRRGLDAKKIRDAADATVAATSATVVHYSPSAYSSAASPALSLRRGVLPFAPTSSLQFNYADAADMDEIITSGSVATVSHPEFDAQDETMDTTDEIGDEIDNAEEEEGEDEAVEVEPEPVPQKKGRKRKRVANAKPPEPRVKWTSKED
ncbi:hypothetical protein D1007_23019 [Hordeum vulgare]|nr:hypothetical protein D1007_23019 [Hordeum vulgare]